MDPFLDEKVVLTVTASFLEVAADFLHIDAQREGYGPTQNEGLCYEYCSGVEYRGKIKLDLYIGMDSYTRILLLPYIVKNLKFDIDRREIADMALDAFSNTIFEELRREVNDYLEDITSSDLMKYNHKMVALPAEQYRKYTIIYFMRDLERGEYLGRVYLHLAFLKD